MKQYIDKDAIVAEIKRRIKAHKESLKNCDSSISELVLKGSMSAYQNLLYILDTLEVKEVDLEKEYKDFVDTLTGKDNGQLSEDELFRIAEYFFEIGLKSTERRIDMYKLELKSSHEVIETVSVADVESIFNGKSEKEQSKLN